MVSAILIALLPIVALISGVNGHGVITAVSGANGVTSQGFGVIASTPRDGSSPNPFEQDTSIIRNQEIESGKTGVCGRTRAGGDNDVTSQLNAAVTSGLPTAAADGTVSMTLHQVNQDGAGPYTCAVSTDATGANFIAMTVTTNVPGQNSLSLAQATDFPLIAQMPAGTACTGGAGGNACLVRCTNSALAGPFGGCAAVSTSNSTATASTASASVVSTNATSATSATATASATSAESKGTNDKLAAKVGGRASEGVIARMEERIRRSRIFAGSRN